MDFNHSPTLEDVHISPYILVAAESFLYTSKARFELSFIHLLEAEVPRVPTCSNLVSGPH